MTKRIIPLILALAFAPPTLAAQLPQGGNMPVAIVMVDELPFPKARAVLVRRKDMLPETVVLVTRETEPADLTRAMAALFNSRSNKGDHITTDMVAPIPAAKSRAPSKDLPQAAKDLRDLRTARARFIEGVGTRPVVFSHLRALAGRTGP